MRISVLVIIFANIVPLGGVLFFGWGIIDLFLLFWAESGIVAFYTIVKVFFAEESKMKEFVSAAFLGFHFAVFMVLHLLLINFIFGGFRETSIGMISGLFYGFLVLFLSHGYSLLRNFLDGDEAEEENVRSLMIRPYKRVLLMQGVMLFLGFGVFLWGEVPIFLLILVVAKVAADVYSHLKEHSKVGSKEAENLPEPLAGF